jgi:hypothetical protein
MSIDEWSIQLSQAMEPSCAIRFIVCPSSNYDFIAEGGIGNGEWGMTNKKAPRAGWADDGLGREESVFLGFSKRGLPAFHRQPI